MKNSLKKQAVLFLILIHFGCGNSTFDENFQVDGGESAKGYIQLNLNEDISPLAFEFGRIDHYHVHIEGEEMTPLEQTLSSDAAPVLIRGIPPGKNRHITIWAKNKRGQILREGSIHLANVNRGEIFNQSLQLHSVPVVLNFTSGDWVSNQRLFFYVITDPNHSLQITSDNGTESPQIMKDIAADVSEKKTDETGLLRFYPGKLPPGDYSFAIRDIENGRKVHLQLHLWEGQNVFAAPLIPAGFLTGRLGDVFVPNDSSTQNLLPNIANALWQKL